MKKSRRNTLLVLMLFLFGQLQIKKTLFSESSYQIKDIQEIVLGSESYFVRNNVLWILQEIPINATGMITTENQEVNYVYEKKEWKNRNKTIAINGEKILAKQKMNSFNGNGNGKTKKVVSSLMGAMCGKLTYGNSINSKFV